MDSIAETPSKANKENEEEEEIFSYAIELTKSIVLPMVMQAALELGVFEIIAKAGPNSKLSAEEIAAQMPTRSSKAPIMLDRILRILVSHRVLGCSFSDGKRLYSLAPVTKYFVRNQDGISLHPVMGLSHNKLILDLWYQLKDAILDGEIPFTKVHRIQLFEYVDIDHKFGEILNRAKFNHTAIVMKRILESYKRFEHIEQLVDVGGGRGATLNMIMSKYPHIKGVNFDLPRVIQDAPSYYGVEHKGGNMFERIPKGDAILMKSILHNWDDDHCFRLLKNCYEALPSKGKVIIIDTICSLMSETSPTKQETSPMDVVMLMEFSEEKERTKQEFVALATRAGFIAVNYECCVGTASFVAPLPKNIQPNSECAKKSAHHNNPTSRVDGQALMAR